jgi:CRISPR-associated protein Cas2
MNEYDILSGDFINYDYEDTYNILIIYDIVNNKKRNKLSKFLKGFGFRIQKSAFECILTKEKYQKLIAGIENFFGESDSIRVYKHNSTVKVKVFGETMDIDESDIYFI